MEEYTPSDVLHIMLTEIADRLNGGGRMVQGEYPIKNKDGKLICMCRQSERDGDPDILTKNGHIPLHELYSKAMCPGKPRNEKSSCYRRKTMERN